MENKSGQGIFYGVIGVATLVVAIIGATFAYFSASAQSTSDITGTTLGGSGGVLGLQVQKVVFTGKTASSLDLVPTNISDKTTIQNAINANCEATPTLNGEGDKYTGCHLYTIHATAQSAVSGASLTLTSLAFDGTAPTDSTKWKYAIFQATGSQGSYAITNDSVTPASFTASNVAIVDNQNLTAGYDETYYLIVYVANDSTTQNAANSADVTGSYTGTVTFSNADGAQVMATFSTTGS